MNRISFRDDLNQEISRLKSLQGIHDRLIDKMFDELGSRFQRKEISDRFWDTLPSDIRSKYRPSVSSVRDKIRDIISKYPQYFEEYRKKNRPYFQKVEKNRQEEPAVDTEESPAELVEVSR